MQWIKIKAVLIGLTAMLILNGCNGGSTSDATSSDGTLPADVVKVVVGFWSTSDCSGDMINSIEFPVNYTSDQCYSWPGHSGENSATNFICGANSLSYTQWTTLTCSGGSNAEGTNKTAYTDKCQQDIPPTIYSKIIDFSGCSAN